MLIRYKLEGETSMPVSMTLKQRVMEAFRAAGVVWPADDTLAVPLGGAALQCQNESTAGLVCDVAGGKPDLMLRNAKLLVLLCTAAGLPETEADQWIASELRAAKNKARRSVKQAGPLRFVLSVDHPPRLVVLNITEGR